MPADDYELEPIARNGDARLDVLDEDARSLLKTKAFREDTYQDSLNYRRQVHDSLQSKKLKQIDLVDGIETEHVRHLRQKRVDVAKNLDAAYELAREAFSDLGLVYDAEQSTIADIYAVTDLHEAEAAESMGLVGISKYSKVGFLIIKVLGMLGCMALSAFGLSALIFHISPQRLLSNPIFLPAAILVSFILIGGAYLILNSTWRRVGAMKAAQPEKMRTKVAFASGLGLTGLAAVLVAAIDFESIVAINATRTMLDPEHAQRPELVLLAAFGLSAMYVFGSSASAYSEAHADQIAGRVEAARKRDAANQLASAKQHVEVQHACEAFAQVIALRRQKQEITAEIERAEDEFHLALDQRHSAIPAPPEMPDEHKKDLRIQKKEVRFAKQKRQAHRANRSKSHE